MARENEQPTAAIVTEKETKTSNPTSNPLTKKTRYTKKMASTKTMTTLTTAKVTAKEITNSNSASTPQMKDTISTRTMKK